MIMSGSGVIVVFFPQGKYSEVIVFVVASLSGNAWSLRESVVEVQGMAVGYGRCGMVSWYVKLQLEIGRGAYVLDFTTAVQV